MKKFLFFCAAILTFVAVTSCNHEQQQPKYVDRYYCYDDDDGMEIILHKDGTFDIYYGITREHLKGTYQCIFPDVSLQIAEPDTLLSEVSMRDNFVNGLDSLKFSANADTLYVFERNSFCLKLTPHNALSHFLFKMGI
jgi:hypothetical protein